MAVLADKRAARFDGERLQDEALRSRRLLPDEAEVGMLGTEELLERDLVLVGTGLGALGRLLPEEVAELLRRVRVAERRLQNTRNDVSHHRTTGPRELRLDVAAEELRRDHAELHLLRAPPERLVLVVEDPREHVPLAAEVDVCDLGLRLEDRAHELREVAVDVDDLLEFVEDERDLPPALGRELARELEQPFQRRLDVLRLPARVEREPELAGLRVDKIGRA